MLPWTQGCRCAPTAGLKLANAFGVMKIANAFGVKKTTNAFGVMKTANAFGVKRRIEIQMPSAFCFKFQPDEFRSAPDTWRLECPVVKLPRPDTLPAAL